MEKLFDFWQWFSTSDNLTALTVFGGAIAVLAGAIWKVYTHFSKRPEPSQMQSGSGIQGSRDIIAGRDVININIPSDFLEKLLKERTTEILAQIPHSDPAKQAMMEKELKTLQEKYEDMEKTKQELEAKLIEASQALDVFNEELPPQQINAAKQALTRGETKVAEALFQQILDNGKEHAAEAAYQLGMLSESRIDFDVAASYFREAAQLLPENIEYVESAGWILFELGRYQEAEIYLKRGLDLCVKNLNQNHPYMATSLNNLASLYTAAGKYAEAEALQQQAIKIQEISLGPENEDLAISLNNLGTLYRIQGRDAEAETLHQRALMIREKVLGPNHPSIANSLNNLATVYREQGRYAEAEPLYQRALNITEETLGPEHPYLAQCQNNLASLYIANDNYAEAEPLCQQALNIREKVLGSNHPSVAKSQYTLAKLYQAQGKYSEAEPLYKSALKIMKMALGLEHTDAAIILGGYIEFLHSLGRDQEAGRLAARAKSVQNKHKKQKQ